MVSKKEIISLLDFFMSAYSWGYDEAFKFVTTTPSDVIVKLYTIANERIKNEYILQTKLTSLAIGTAFGGKKAYKALDKLFEVKSEEETETDFNNQLFGLYSKMGKSTKALAKKLKNGEEVKL